MASFVPCPRCHRHVRSTEASCVFCGVSRAVQAAALLSVAVALGGCDPKPLPDLASPPVPSASVAPSAEPAPLASAPPAPAATPDPVASGVATPPVRPAMRYGIAPRK